MSFTVGGSTPQLTFADATVQNTAALPLTGGSVSADITVNGLTVGRGAGAVSTNTAVGASALAANTSGASNTSLGYQALYSNTTASNSTAVGYQAGYTNATGSANSFFGYQAGYTSAVSSTTAGNTCIGAVTGYGLTTGTYNTFVGFGASVGGVGAGYYVTTGSKNTIIGGYNGNQGGLDIRTASNYIVLSDGDGNPRVSIPTGTATATIPNATGTVMVSGNMPAFSAYASGNQNGLTSGTYVKAVFNTKIFDTNNNYDNTTNYRFTPTVAGYYQVNISYYLNGTGLIGQANIYKTGYLYQGTQYTNTTTTTSCIISISTIIYLNGSTDYIEGYVYGSTTAGTWQIQGAITYTYFNAVLVRGA